MPEPGPLPAGTNPLPLKAHLASIYKAWNAAYRGLVPKGIPLPAPDSDPEYDDPITFDDTEMDITYADPETIDFRQIVPIPVVIIDDIQETIVAFESYQFNVGSGGSILLVNRHVKRTDLRISNNGPGIVYIGNTESVGVYGYACQVNEAFTLTTKRDVWAVQQSGQTGPAIVSVIYEYEVEIT